MTAILTMYHQQEEMYRSKTHTCANRILSIFQPHVRAIVRGKAKARTEFGAKIGASIVEGYTFIDYHSWDAYNESQDLLLQIQLFKERFGYLPATILADKIPATMPETFTFPVILEGLDARPSDRTIQVSVSRLK